jgi:flavin reductase (DIM6/NTAB) family NADH-FMN oxidoreductase RutF
MSNPNPAIDVQHLRRALGRFTTGVTIITCVDSSGERHGLTANSFNSLSLEPPLVLWSLRTASPSLAPFSAATHFAVNVLAEAQVDLSRRFASSRLERHERFEEGPWASGLSGLPVLHASAAVFECRAVSQQLAGDHVLFIGEVLACSETALPPLLYQGGHYRSLGEMM